MMIGILDCGLGGLTAARALCDNLPGQDVVYFGDTAHGNYGNLSAERIIRYSLENVKQLVDRGAGMIAVSSHAMSALALFALKDKTNIPILDIISPTVKAALASSRFQKIGVMGTRAVIDSAVYQNQILNQCPEASVHCSKSPLLSSLIEEEWLRKPETRGIIKKYLLPLKVRQIDTLIPACGHYMTLIETIRAKIGKRVHVIQPPLALVREIQLYLERHSPGNEKTATPPTRKFIVSDITEHIQKAANLLYGKALKLQKD